MRSLRRDTEFLARGTPAPLRPVTIDPSGKQIYLCIMKVEITYDSPEPAWLSIKHQIEAMPDFCDDVTLEVTKAIFAGDRVFRFLDRADVSIPTSHSPDPVLEPNRFVEWVHDEFKLRELRTL